MNTMNAGQGADALPGAVSRRADAERVAMSRELVASADLVQALSNLRPSKEYTVVLSRAVGGSLNLRPDGTYDAFVKGADGKIAAVARLQRVGPRLLTSAGMLAGHALLVQISSQLDRLQDAVSTVRDLMRAEKYGSIQGAVARMATLRDDDPQLPSELQDIVGRLSDALGQIVEMARVSMHAIPAPPETPLGHMTRGSKPTESALTAAEADVRVVLRGLNALVQAKWLLSGLENAAQMAEHWLTTVLGLPLDEAEIKARGIPATRAEERRELFWQETRRALETALERVRASASHGEPLRVEATISPGDLDEALRAASAPPPPDPIEVRPPIQPAPRARPPLSRP